jgi:ABC-type multidrug transport system fused ATPase/permease subunit
VGNHEELMQNCDIYRDIFKSQLGEEMISND